MLHKSPDVLMMCHQCSRLCKEGQGSSSPICKVHPLACLPVSRGTCSVQTAFWVRNIPCFCGLLKLPVPGHRCLSSGQPPLLPLLSWTDMELLTAFILVQHPNRRCASGLCGCLRGLGSHWNKSLEDFCWVALAVIAPCFPFFSSCLFRLFLPFLLTI